MKTILLIVAALSSTAALAGTEDALKSIPSGELKGITILGCEAKPDTYTINCRSGGKCTITVVNQKVTCKGKKS